MTKKMNAKLIFLILFIFFAASCLIGGVSFYCLSLGSVKLIPQSLDIEKIDDAYCLVAQHNNNYAYKFKIEQLFDDDFFVLYNLQSKSNTLNLDEVGIVITPGEKYRFSVCYVGESACGEYSDYLNWQPVSVLRSVDYDKVEVTDGILRWKEVENASGYSIKLVSSSGRVSSYDSAETQFSVRNLAGCYQIFIMAKSANSNYLNSYVGDGKKFVLYKTNEIRQATLLDGKLKVITSQAVSKFELYQDEILIATVDGVEKSNLNYEIDLSILLGNIDPSKLKIKSQTNGYILESRLETVAYIH